LPLARKPDWLKTRLPAGETSRDMDRLLSDLKLHTVCASARCPNLGECWGAGTATFMILGDTCTRHCRFCAVRSGSPGGALDDTEPQRVAQAAVRLKLRHVVVTSVDRDDLSDLGAGHFARTVAALRRAAPAVRVEVLIPDFAARSELLQQVVNAGPDIIAHNLETVEELTPKVRDHRAGYQLSLRTLEMLSSKFRDSPGFPKRKSPGRSPISQGCPRISPVTKSGIMLGLGETREQVLQTLRDMRSVGVSIVTIGQYLQPRRTCLPVREYVTPKQFAEYGRIARALGFAAVASAPLMRSSYHAADIASSPFGGDCPGISASETRDCPDL
jgi:lipoic acid synthetase